MIVLRKGVRKGEELKAPCYASAAVIRDYITTRDIIPNNYQGLNIVTIKNWYPLLLIHKILDILCSTKYFIKLNIIAMFN